MLHVLSKSVHKLPRQEEAGVEPKLHVFEDEVPVSWVGHYSQLKVLQYLREGANINLFIVFTAGFEQVDNELFVHCVHAIELRVLSKKLYWGELTQSLRQIQNFSGFSKDYGSAQLQHANFLSPWISPAMSISQLASLTKWRTWPVCASWNRISLHASHKVLAVSYLSSASPLSSDTRQESLS